MAKKRAAGKAPAKTKSKAKTKAPGGRSIKNAAGATAKPPIQSDVKLTAHGDLERLIKRSAALRQQGKEIAGSLGDLVSSAVENKNLDKPAFDIVRKLWKMSPQKRLTTLACFDHYRLAPVDGKLLDNDETGQGELSIPRQEAGAKGEPAKDPTGASVKSPEQNGAAKNGAPTPTDGPKDLRPPHLRTVAEGGTKIDTVDELKRTTGATGGAEASRPH